MKTIRISVLILVFITIWSITTFEYQRKLIQKISDQQLKPTPLYPIQFPQNWTDEQKARVYDQYCHSDPGLEIIREPNRSVIASNCVGKCHASNRTSVTYLQRGIKAPTLKALCLLNPFHGFYDCVWPLIHYLRVCGISPLNDEEDTTIYLDEIESPIRRRTWAFMSRELYLQHWQSETGMSVKIISDECVCFKSLVSFRKEAMWRPILFHSIRRDLNTVIEMLHPILLRKEALKSFREVVWKYGGLSDNDPLKNRYVLVYGRADATRRRWKNVLQFVDMLKTNDIPVVYVEQMPKDYWSQIRLHQQASIVIAGHGASLVNTLVMRPGSVVIEIANKHCYEKSETEQRINLREITPITDPNVWTPWHAEVLGIYHWYVACWKFEYDINQDFFTDNEHLIELTILTRSLVNDAHSNNK